ncbi:MAG: ABC transporter ATP-binding protein [Candidatus Riflebacteria bacterium]|nr:ABC transporter ATP-binding protein [Candidatus Riflebacteria bacterium]
MNLILKLASFCRPYWKKALLALLLLSSVVVMDLSIPRLIQRIIDQGIARHDQAVVIHTALIMICLSMLSALFAIGNNYFSVQVGESVARDLRDALFLKIQTFSFGNLDRQRTGQLMVRLTSDINAVKTMIQISLRIGTRAPLLMIGSLILMVNTSKILAMTLLPLLMGTLIIIVFFITKMEPLFRGVQQKLDKLNNVLQENVAGVRLVKAFVRSGFEEERFETANNALTDCSIRVTKFMAAMSPALTVCVNAGMVIVIWSGGLQAIRGELSIGQVVAFTNYLLTTMTPLILMGMLSNTWAAGLVSARRVNEILETSSEVTDKPDAVIFHEKIRGRIVFDNVSFHYGSGSDEPVLKNINLVAEPGEVVAILGATGAGKTSLIDLIPRYYDVTSGKITIDEIDIRDLKQENLFAQCGIVPQESILFSGTVRDNIRYGRPDATEEEVIAAAKAAQAHDFIMERPLGYDSRVEQRGMNLSGGQKQRIAIARALLIKPRILILDDSTSSVDVETEIRIQNALADQMPRQTTLLVTQRVSTALKADKIVVLDKGSIAALGTHQELLISNQIYREIYDSQLGSASDIAEVRADRQESIKK